MANAQLPTIPSALINPLRAALQAQGMSPDIVRNDGTLDPGKIVASAFDELEFRSAVTPTIVVKTADLLSPGSSPFTRFVQPTLIARGGVGGNVTIAPYGVPSEGRGALTSVLAVGGIFLLGMLFGRMGK